MWERIPSVLTTQQVDEFLRSPRKSDSYCLRDRALLEVLYATGCRASEVCTLRMRDMSLEERHIRCQGKGGKQRLVPIGSRAIVAIQSYCESLRGKLAAKNTHPPEELFLSRSGRALDRIERGRLGKGGTGGSQGEVLFWILFWIFVKNSNHINHKKSHSKKNGFGF